MQLAVLILAVSASGFVVLQGPRRVPRGRLASSSVVVDDEPRTALSDSFDGAVADAANALITATQRGETLVRLDFDTTGGDATYTTLKNSFEFARGVVAAWADAVDGTVCVFFPDSGAAALAASQWKLGTDESLVPENIRLAGFPRDKLEDGDVAVLVVCPRASEAGATEQLIRAAELVPVALINPELVDMGVTGFGLAGRMLKERLLDNMLPVYCLKTIEWGALVKTYPAPYSVYQEDPDVPGGYRFLKSTPTLPNGDDLDEIFAEFNPDDADGGANPLAQAAEGFGKFIDNFAKL